MRVKNEGLNSGSCAPVGCEVRVQIMRATTLCQNCKHGPKWHSLVPPPWDPERVPDGKCFHWENKTGFCKCEGYNTTRTSDQNQHPASIQPQEQ